MISLRLKLPTHSIAGENDIVVVRLEKDAIPEKRIGVVVNDKNLFVTHDKTASEVM